MKVELEDLNRKSLLTHLAKGDLYRAEQKIEDNLSQININVNDLERYYKKLEAKKEKKEFIRKGNSIIECTGQIFEETLLLIKDFKAYKFTNHKERVKYYTILQGYEQRCLNSKKKLTEISEKINALNMNVIETERQSILQSRRGTNATPLDSETQIFQSKLEEGLLAYEYKEDLDTTMIEERGKQVQLILKVMTDIQQFSNDCLKIVIKSADTVDSICDNIHEANENTNKALKEIKQANQINKDSSDSGFFNMNKVIIVLVVFVFVLFLIALSK